MSSYDFSGWATRNDLKCSDGRTIRKDAFKDDDGHTVPLVWNHRHDEVDTVLGHALLKNRADGVYAYCKFNDTPNGQKAKKLVKNGDISALSIYANKLKQNGGDVVHGVIREVSLVLASANPGAYIDSVMIHGEESDEEAVIYNGLDISIEDVDYVEHSDERNDEKTKKENENMDAKKNEESKEKTVGEVFETLTDEQKEAVYALIGMALEENDDENDDEDNTDGGKMMKHNVFENDMETEDFLTHADQEEILSMAKNRSVGTLRNAIDMYMEDNDALAHGIDSVEKLFPDAEDLMKGAPEKIPENDAWVTAVMNGVHKTPFQRVRTRQADISAVRARGYNTKGSKKKDAENWKLVERTTDPQTVYVKDALNRDDILDITDFDVVAYQFNVLKGALNEEIATAILIGDGRDDGEDKIQETNIRPIWTDDELYTIHADVDIKKTELDLQGSGTVTNFGENYVYAESIVTAALYAKEKYKGSGNMVFFCSPHLLNVMMLARDMNGRRIYTSKNDLTAALDVRAIHTVEKFEGRTRKTSGDAPKTKKLLGLFVNLNDYNVGSVKGGQVTSFDQFDIDFNQQKFMMEARLSGALTRVKSAIALEEPVEG